MGQMKRALAFAAAVGTGTAGGAAAGPPPTAQDVIAAFKARDWATLRAITADQDVYVRPDGGAPEVIGRISRAQFFERLHDCVATFTFVKGEYQKTNGVEML